MSGTFQALCNSCCSNLNSNDRFTSCGHFVCVACSNSSALRDDRMCPICGRDCDSILLNERELPPNVVDMISSDTNDLFKRLSEIYHFRRSQDTQNIARLTELLAQERSKARQIEEYKLQHEKDLEQIRQLQAKIEELQQENRSLKARPTAGLQSLQQLQQQPGLNKPAFALRSLSNNDEGSRPPATSPQRSFAFGFKPKLQQPALVGSTPLVRRPGTPLLVRRGAQPPPPPPQAPDTPDLAIPSGIGRQSPLLRPSSTMSRTEDTSHPEPGMNVKTIHDGGMKITLFEKDRAASPFAPDPNNAEPPPSPLPPGTPRRKLVMAGSFRNSGIPRTPLPGRLGRPGTGAGATATPAAALSGPEVTPRATLTSTSAASPLAKLQQMKAKLQQAQNASASSSSPVNPGTPSPARTFSPSHGNQDMFSMLKKRQKSSIQTNSSNLSNISSSPALKRLRPT